MPVEMMEEIQSTLPIGGQKVDEHFPAEFRIFTSGNVHGGGSSLDEGLGIFFPPKSGSPRPRQLTKEWLKTNILNINRCAFL